MIVNMYVDHLMDQKPQNPEEVWNAAKLHGKLFSDAAERIGLTPREYHEFLADLLDGKAVYVRLPRRVDAMSGVRRGAVYAVHNAVMTQPVMGWRVRLADGNEVYVPQVCGNISLLRHAAVAVAPASPRSTAYHAPYTEAVASVPKETPVIMTPPQEAAPVVETAPVVAQAVSANHGPFTPFWFIPVALGGLVAAVNHGNTPPPCNQGSNAVGVCSK